MSRITKQIANAVANQLVLSKKQELEKEMVKLAEIATTAYLTTVPAEVMDLFNKYPDYLRVRSYIKLNQPGFNFEGFALTNYCPEKSSDHYPIIPEIQADKIRVQADVVYTAKKELETLTFDIETAIFNLRTYANVEKEFPEAFKLLPVKQTTALIVNLKDIRCKLDKANC